MRVKLRAAARAAMLLLAAAVFVVGAADYMTKNGEELLRLSLGTKSEELAAQPQATTPAQIEDVKEEPEQEAVETGMEWDSGPVEFLEEVLPQASPDPKRPSNPVKELECSGGKEVENFFVNDSSDSGLDLLEELKKQLPVNTDNLKEPTVLLYHTHTCEGYSTGFTGFYYTDSSFRSTNSERNVITVGEQMKKALEEMGIGVIHDTTVHDSPAFNGAYQRSMDTVQENLEKYPSIQVTIDLHRDSMTTDEGLSYKPTTRVEGRKAAQVMIIAGSDPTGELEFENWRDNLVFALKLQKEAADSYPGLMRPMMYCQRKYNMDATNASLIFEVGTEVNTYAEARYSGTLMGKVLGNVLLQAKGKE